MTVALKRKQKQTCASCGIWILDGCMNRPLKLTPVYFVPCLHQEPVFCQDLCRKLRIVSRPLNAVCKVSRLKVILQFLRILFHLTVIESNWKGLESQHFWTCKTQFLIHLNCIGIHQCCIHFYLKLWWETKASIGGCWTPVQRQQSWPLHHAPLTVHGLWTLRMTASGRQMVAKWTLMDLLLFRFG